MPKPAKNRVIETVVIGGSAGSMDVLKKIIPSLSADVNFAVLIACHVHRTSDDFLARYLNELSKIKVKQAYDKSEIKKGTVYVAPPNYHLMVEWDKTIALSVDEHVNFSRPSIDVLFETAADAYGKNLAGVILTGANFDGSNGLKRIKSAGGLAIVQDPESAEADVMPRAALDAVDVDAVLPVQEIGAYINHLVTGEV